MDTVAGGFHEFSSQEDLNSEGKQVTLAKQM